MHHSLLRLVVENSCFALPLPKGSNPGRNAERRLQFPAQGNALGSVVDGQEGTLKEFAKLNLGNPFRVGQETTRFPRVAR
jgi:hypothetical protein